MSLHANGGVIGRGVHYHVYDLGKGRVRKIPNTSAQTIKVLKTFWENSSTSHGQVKKIADLKRRQRDINFEWMRTRCSKSDELHTSLGNPTFESNGSYTQDKVKTLGEAILVASANQAETLIGKYIRLLLLHWRYRLADNNYNFTINNGVNADSQVILLDFGGITSDKKQAAAGVREQIWRDAWSASQVSNQLREHYFAAMKEKLTIQVLNGIWDT